MPIKFSPVAVVAASLALSSVALAEDVRITYTGTVASVVGGGVATQPFAGATVGDPVSVQVDVEIVSELPNQFGHYLVNWPTSAISIGNVSDGLARSSDVSVTPFDLLDAPVTALIFQGDLSSSSTSIKANLFDSSGLLLNSGELGDLVGTSLPLAGWNIFFEIESPQGSVEFTLSSVDIAAAPGGLLGTPYCAAEPNSLGRIGMLEAYGLATPGDNDLTLTAYELPPSRFGYFLVSDTQGFTPGAGGSMGNLCLGGAIGRFNDSVKRSGTDGRIAVALDLGSLPGPTGTIAVQAGQTWYFQLWQRDFSVATGPTSNFTRALGVTFQ